MIELNKIHNMDYKEGYKEIEEGTIDLIITSPPYNLGGKFHTGNTRYNQAYDIYSDKVPEEIYQQEQVDFLNSCYEKLQDGGSMFYNHKPRIKDGICIHPLEWIFKSNFILKQEIVWKNRSQNFDKIRFYPFSERIYWLVKSPKTKLFNEVGLSDVWEDIKNKKRDELHKATFPIDLPLNIIKCFKDAKIVLDPYIGIGTTAKAVIEYNKQFNDDKKYIGFDISEQYCNRSEEDIKAMKSSF